MSNMNTYKKDIDGLRAIAIISVLFFHMDFSLFSGGYVGVDIFFVISGYLITGILYNSITNKEFKLCAFYMRRVRRLAPSIILVMLCCWLLGFFIQDADSFLTFGKTLLSSLFFVSNWYFYTQTGYFDAQLESNPLLHTWSLSVEEQFYFFWPMLMLVFFHLVSIPFKKRIYLLGIFTLVSWFVAIILVHVLSNENVFFNTWARVCELSVGALLAVLAVHWRVPQSWVSALRMAGFFCVFIPIFLYDKSMVYPGLASILPVAGAAFLLMASSCSSGLGYGFLSCAPMRFIGGISYSLYLWHWPLIVYFTFFWLDRTLIQSWLLIVLSLFLAYLTTYFVENPIRFKRTLRSDKKFIVTIALLVLLLFGLSILTIMSKGLPQRWIYKDINLHSANYDFKDAFDVGGCFISDGHTTKELVAKGCLVPDKNKINMLLIGDSFAAQLMPGLKKHFPEIHINQATASACRGLIDVADPTQNWGDWPCPSLNALLFHDVVKRPDYDVIMLVSDWQYWEGPIDGIALIKTIKHIHNFSEAEVVVIGNSPVYKRATEANFRVHAVTNKALFSKLEFRDNLMKVENFNKENIAKNEFISIIDNYCHEGVCPIVSPDGNLIHFGDHLTEWGAIEVIRSLKPEITRVIERAQK